MNPLSLEYLVQRSQEGWLVGINAQSIVDLVTDLTTTLHRQLQQQRSSIAVPHILLVESDPARFLAGFFATCIAGYPVFLGNPQWTSRERHQVMELIQPDVILTEGRWNAMANFGLVNRKSQHLQSSNPCWVMIPTGGSSGAIRFAVHTWETLMASVQGFQQWFQVDRVHSYCVLPLHHVSGLMQCLRSYVTGGQLAWQAYNQLQAAQPLPIDPTMFFMSLVPTQLQRLLALPADPTVQESFLSWLGTFRAILVGGAPTPPFLLNQAREWQLPLAPTYGMTETASQVATLLPADFLAGKSSYGRSLPHAHISIRSTYGDVLPAGEIGTIAIQCKALHWGYYQPDQLAITNQQAEYITDDLGFVDSEGYLHVVGRNSHKIITGGENVFPAEVEAAILETALVCDVCVVGVPNDLWGEVVTAVYVPAAPTVTEAELRLAVLDRLSAYKQPKYWLAVASLPRNLQGKLDRYRMQQLASCRLANPTPNPYPQVME
jgi:O-succinylbenzoic acid--CoA ligase